ncbi:hypothetical protein LEMLEM_LOCUS7923, partial [Lemmus lemmus]
MTETVNHTEEITLQAQFMKISIKGTTEHDCSMKRDASPRLYFMKLPQESMLRKKRCLHIVESSIPTDDQPMEDTWKGKKNDCLQTV